MTITHIIQVPQQQKEEMSSKPLPPNEPFLASYLRVQRGKDLLQNLIEGFPDLEQKAFDATITDIERRRLLDLPDAEEEAENIRQVSSRSREELISNILSDRGSLSDDEIQLLQRKFWSRFTSQEIQARFNASLNRIQESADPICSALDAAYLPNESQAFLIAAQESTRRTQKYRDDKQRTWGDPYPPSMLPWMLSLSQRFEQQPDLNTWGYVALYDAEVQKIDAEQRDLFRQTFGSFFRSMMGKNGARRQLLNQKWRLFEFNAPLTAFVSTEPNADNSGLRSAFRDLMDEDKEWHDIDPHCSKTMLKKHRGFLTNTFLVLVKICVESVLSQPGYLDDMRILAFEADFPVRTVPTSKAILVGHGSGWNNSSTLFTAHVWTTILAWT